MLRFRPESVRIRKRLVLLCLILGVASLCGCRIEWAGEEEEALPAHMRLFESAPKDVRVVASVIARGEVPTAAQLAAIDDLDARYGDDLTLFWHALACGNVPALEALVEAGASMLVRARRDRGFHFYEIMAQPGGSLIGPDGIAELVRIYLENGGDPNATWTYPDSSEIHVLAPTFGLYGNLRGVQQLLDAGADPWLHETAKNGQRLDNLVMALAASTDLEALALLDRMIDAGAFENRSLDEIRGVIRNLSSYAQRGDELSIAKQRLGMRILKRYPDYFESGPSSLGVGRLFKTHYTDEAPGQIPWDRIRSAEVR